MNALLSAAGNEMALKLSSSLIACFAIGSVVLTAISIARAADVPGAASSLELHLDEASGAYSVSSPATHWTFAGSLGAAPLDVAVNVGKDPVGAYHEISFHLKTANAGFTGSMRAYDENPAVLFSMSADTELAKPAMAFPSFTALPSALHTFSYMDKVFSPPAFTPVADGSPWLLFDNQLHAAIISPAAHFAISRISGDAKTTVSAEFRPELTHIPAGFAEQTLLVVDQGINRTWNTWGHALSDLQGKVRPANDADAVLKYLGYWTDNGAFYYYHYDPAKGYAGTLLALVDYFRKQQIPVRYLQLDSWWYYKTLTGPNGKEGKPKVAGLPTEEWNRYGGLLEYRAHPTVFPEGLAAFKAKVGMPLVTHNRWIDPKSPYRQKYKVSGFAGVDPGYWKEIIDYCKSSGVATYEQDWLNEISLHSPELLSTPTQADAFLDGMANACRDDGLTVQYCMPLPWELMQESKYSNLTTSRVSNDRFQISDWRWFLFTSRIVSALGSWPWTDVCMSVEPDNLLLSVLSGGAVGFGDEQGKEDKANLLRAARTDGVLVKPDAAIVPLDQCYLTEAQTNLPIVASTFTDRDGLKTGYVFSFSQSKKAAGETRFVPADMGFNTPVYVYDFVEGTGLQLKAGAAFTAPISRKNWDYYVVAPVGKSGIAFLGDKGKFVGTGRQRVSQVEETAAGLSVDLVFAASESAVTLHGYSTAAPTATVESGTAGQVHYDGKTKYFTVEVDPDLSKAAEAAGADPIRHVLVRLQIK